LSPSGSPTPAPSAAPLRFRDRVISVLWFLLGAGFLLALPVLTGVHPAVVPSLLALAVLAGGVWTVLRGRSLSKRNVAWLGRWLQSSLALLFAMGTVLAVPIYVLALAPALKPLLAPQVTLSNGKQTLIFQGAVHVGSEPFYKSMVYDMERALSEGYVIYYEGVKPHPQGDRWFSETLAGGHDLNDSYKRLGTVCGLKFQGEYFGALGAAAGEHPDRHVVADVDTFQLKQEYERLIQADPWFAARVRDEASKDREAADGPDLMSALMGWAQDGDPRHHALAGVVCRGVMTYALNAHAGKPSTLDPLLLDFRNRALVERIRGEPRSRIFVNYGADHLPGVLRLLRQGDPGWKVLDQRWMRALEAPEDLHGPAID